MTDNFLFPIGRRIAEIRKAQKLTQEEVSTILNVTPKHISHVERGESSFSLKNLIEFSQVTHASLDYIILGETENNILGKLPPEITHILNTGTQEDIQRLNRYLQLYLELTSKQD